MNTPAEAKRLLAEALEGVLGDTSTSDERMFVAHSLGGLARMVREGAIDGFEWKWKRGSGVIDATNLVVLNTPLKSIIINIGEENADGEPEEV